MVAVFGAHCAVQRTLFGLPRPGAARLALWLRMPFYAASLMLGVKRRHWL